MGELIIRHAGVDDYEQLTRLWLSAFDGDSTEYVRSFLRDIPHETVIMLGEQDSRLVTMLFLLPASANFRGENYPVRYLYAGCTHPQYRGCGYYRQLMDAAAQEVRTMGEHAIYLHPADERLTETYHRFGYRSGICGGSHMAGKHHFLDCVTVDNYLKQRESVGKLIAKTTVYWDLSESVTRRFVADAVSVGAVMETNMLCARLLLKDRTIETLHADVSRSNSDYCLWLPLSDSPLMALMEQYQGFTGLVGD